MNCRHCQTEMEIQLWNDIDFVIYWCHNCGTIWNGHYQDKAENGKWSTSNHILDIIDRNNHWELTPDDHDHAQEEMP